MPAWKAMTGLGLGFRIQDSWFRVKAMTGLGLGFRIQDSWFRV
jgi:hypothetical protein